MRVPTCVSFATIVVIQQHYSLSGGVTSVADSGIFIGHRSMLISSYQIVVASLSDK